MPKAKPLPQTPYFYKELDAEKALELAQYAILPGLMMAERPALVFDFDETLCDNREKGKTLPCVEFLQNTIKMMPLEKTFVVLTARNNVPSNANFLDMWFKTNNLNFHRLILRPESVALTKSDLMAWKHSEREKLVKEKDVLLVVGDQWGDLILAPEYLQAPLPKKGKAFWICDNSNMLGTVRLLVNF